MKAAATTQDGSGNARLFALAMFALAFASFLLAGPAQARSLIDESRYAAIVVDADTQEVLYAHNADAARHPASITKVMTTMLAFEELDAGRLNLDDRVYISKYANSMECSCSGLTAGDWLTVEQAIRTLATKSANDVAVALAERIAGSEVAFAQRMTEKARSLGMNATSFYNANGLPNPAHSTSARDLATMSAAVIRDYPHYYAFFSQQSFTLKGRSFRNHNKLLGKLVGLDGIKTGYTRASGSTLAASAQRDGKRLIAIVLGAPSSAARNDNIAELINSGFDVLRQRRYGRNLSVASLMNEPAQLLDIWSSSPVTAQGSALDVEEEPSFEPTGWLDEATNSNTLIEELGEVRLPAAFAPFVPGENFQSYAWLR